MLKDLSNLIKELNSTNSSNEKKEILRKYPQCKELLTWIYSYKTLFNVTSKNIKKRNDLVDVVAYGDIISLLTALNNRDITGHAAISAVNAFINTNPEYEELIYLIIDKNLKTRTDAKLINSIYPNLIPEFHVALANKYEDFAHKIDFENEVWFASRKLDGVRCLAIPVDNTNWQLMSRQGKEFSTLQKVIDDLKKLELEFSVVFDGEICIVDENGNEKFDGIMKGIRRKDHTIVTPKYKIFDMIQKQDFDRGESDEEFYIRTASLSLIKDRIEELGLTSLDVVDQIPVKDETHLMKMMDYAVSEGWEGLIVRKNTQYKGKRSNDLLKVKKMHDTEYIIEGVEIGPFRVISKETGLEVEEEMMTRVNIKHKGNTVGVGSGFSLDERRAIYNDPNSVIGKTMCVKYFEETENKEGLPSLRFPIKKFIYEGERDV